MPILSTFKHVNVDSALSITVPSVYFWENILQKIPNVPVELDEPWWLEDEGNWAGRALVVTEICEVKQVWKTNVASIRPMFAFSKPLGELGHKIFVNNIPCTIVHDFFALSDVLIGAHSFDNNNNYFADSDLSAFLQSEQYKNMLKKYLPF